MAINTVGISVLPNHAHSIVASNDGGSLSNLTSLNTSTLVGYILLNGSGST